VKVFLPIKTILVFIVFVSLLSNKGWALSIDQVIADATRPHNGLLKQYFSDQSTSQKFQDKVDPYTGNLEAKINGISIPGNGGLDINVDWSYRMEGLRNLGSSRISPNSSAMFDDTPWSPGAWSLNVAPRIAFYAGGNNPSGDYDICNPPPYTPGFSGASAYGFGRISLEFADGHAERLYYTAAGVFETRGRWRLACDAATNTHTLWSPNGIVYRLGNRTKIFASGPRYLVVYQTTRAIDRNGNYYDISYVPITAINCLFDSVNGSSVLQAPSQIVASDGRVVSFTYDGGGGGCAAGGRGPRLIAITGPNGATWKFEYAASVLKSYYRLSGQLSRIVLPDNTAFQFQYQDVCPTTNMSYTTFLCGYQALSKVILPTGGFVGYEYKTFFDVNAEGYARYLLCNLGETAGCYWGSPPSEDQLSSWNGTLQQTSYVFAQPDVMKRFTSDGGVWTYAYDRSVNKASSTGLYDVTTIDGPSGRTIHRFMGLGFFTPAGLAGYSRWSNVCNIDAHPPGDYCSVFYPGAWQVGLPVDVQIGNNYLETYTWASRILTTLDDEDISARVHLRDGDRVLVPDLQKKRIVIDGAAYETTYSNYDQYGNPGTISESGPGDGNRTTSLTYYVNTAKWILHQIQNESFTGSATSRVFDTNGNLISLTTDGVTTSHTYDSQGNIASTTFPRNLTHSYSNYKRGIPQSESQPENITLTREVSDAGNIVSETNGEGYTTSYSYDGLNRVTSITYPLGSNVSVSYSPTSQTAVRGGLTETTLYDSFGRVASITLGGVSRSYGYDSLGRKTFESNPGDTRGASYSYDILNRLTQVTNVDGSAKVISYGAGSMTVTDERAKSTTYAYRSYGDPNQRAVMNIAAPDPSANIVLARNAKDLVTEVTQGGITRKYGYNANYYITSIVNPETGTTLYGRDDAGNTISRSVGSSGITTYAYDGQNRLASITYPGSTPSVTNTYSKTGKLKSVTSSAAVRAYGYDANDNLINESVTLDGVVNTINYVYNNLDQLFSISYPRSGKIVNYSPDVLGRPTQVSGYVNNISYWPSGQVQQINYVNGTTTNYGQNLRLWSDSLGIQKNGSYYLSNSYSYDGAGNLATITDSVDSSFNRSLGYDNINRLTGVNGPWGSGTIAYDGKGNITSQIVAGANLTYSYDGNNRLIGNSGSRVSSYTYDVYGNVASDGNKQFSYDDAPNLRCVNCATNPILYTYDGRNTRVSSTKNGVKSYEIYAYNGNLLSEYTPSTGLLIEHIYIPGRRVASRRQNNGTTLSVTPNPSATGQTITLSANVTGFSPGGTVTFNDGGTVLGSAAVIGGVANLTISTLSLGTHSLVASYAGDANNPASTSSPISQVIRTTAPTTTTFSIGPNPSEYGQSVTLSANVSGFNPSGVMNFKENGSTFATVPLSSGNAILVLNALTLGNHGFSAAYGGDSKNDPSTSTTVTQVVNPAVTKTVLTTSSNLSNDGQPIILTATVTGRSPIGGVTFTDGNTTLGTVSMVNGVASMTVSNFGLGTHNIAANYPGDATHTPSAATISLSVTRVGTQTILTPAVVSARVGTTINLSINVKGVGTNPSGTVTLKDGTNVIATLTLINGSASFSTNSFSKGTRFITAIYNGDSSNAPSTASQSTVTVYDPIAIMPIITNFLLNN